MRRILGVLLVSLTAAGVEGATLRVPQDYSTINAALGVALAGDSVLVAPGTYSQYEVRVLHGGGPFTASSVAFLKGGVSLIGEGGRDVTRIDLAGQGVGSAVPVLAYNLGPGTILVQGFTITGAPVGSTGMWSRFMDRMVIRACRFADLDGGSTRPGGLYSETVDLEIYDTEFRNCRIEGGPYREAAIHHIEGDATLNGCSFADCEGPDIVSLDAIGVSPAFSAEVRNCEFRNNAGLGARLESFVDLTVEGCVFVGNHPSAGASALIVSGGGGGIIVPGPYYVRKNLFAQNQTASGYGTVFWDRVSGTFEQNTLVGNGTRGLTLTYYSPDAVAIRQNVFAWTGGTAIELVTSLAPLPTSDCNDYWNNGQNTAGFAPGPTDLFVDPQFCDRDQGNYTVTSASPCVPPQSGACDQIGAFSVGCKGVAVEPETWARTKARFRIDTNRREGP